MNGDCCTEQGRLHDHKNHFPAKPSDLDVYVTGLPLPDEVKQYSECSEDKKGLCRWEREDRDEHLFYQGMFDVELDPEYDGMSQSYSQTKKLRMRLLQKQDEKYNGRPDPTEPPAWKRAHESF